MLPVDKVFWLRVLIAILAGSLSGLLNAKYGLPGSDGALLGLFIYMLSYYLVRFTMANDFPVKNKMLTTGLGSYIAFFLFTWILVNTFLTIGFS